MVLELSADTLWQLTKQAFARRISVILVPLSKNPIPISLLLLGDGWEQELNLLPGALAVLPGIVSQSFLKAFVKPAQPTQPDRAVRVPGCFVSGCAQPSEGSRQRREVMILPRGWWGNPVDELEE